MHLYNYISVVLLVSRLNLAFLSPSLSRGIDKVLVCLYPYGSDNPRNTLWILLGLRIANNCPLNRNLALRFAGIEMNG
jgi:hypothetical protein